MVMGFVDILMVGCYVEFDFVVVGFGSSIMILIMFFG